MEELEQESEENSMEDGPNEPADQMSHEDDPEYVIEIEYSNFITRFDLDEIVESIDRIIETELFEAFNPEYRFLRRSYPYLNYPVLSEGSGLSFIGIRSVESGSIWLTVIASGAVATYVARRFKKGIDKSLFAEELERSGRMVGDVMGGALRRINDWAEKYVPKQKELGGNVKRIAVRKKKSAEGGEKQP